MRLQSGPVCQFASQALSARCFRHRHSHTALSSPAFAQPFREQTYNRKKVTDKFGFPMTLDLTDLLAEFPETQPRGEGFADPSADTAADAERARLISEMGGEAGAGVGGMGGPHRLTAILAHKGSNATSGHYGASFVLSLPFASLASRFSCIFHRSDRVFHSSACLRDRLSSRLVLYLPGLLRA